MRLNQNSKTSNGGEIFLCLKIRNVCFRRTPGAAPLSSASDKRSVIDRSRALHYTGELRNWTCRKIAVITLVPVMITSNHDNDAAVNLWHCLNDKQNALHNESKGGVPHLPINFPKCWQIFTNRSHYAPYSLQSLHVKLNVGLIKSNNSAGCQTCLGSVDSGTNGVVTCANLAYKNCSTLQEFQTIQKWCMQELHMLM